MPLLSHANPFSSQLVSTLGVLPERTRYPLTGAALLWSEAESQSHDLLLLGQEHPVSQLHHRKQQPTGIHTTEAKVMAFK